MKAETYIEYVTTAVGSTPYGAPIHAATLADNLAEVFQIDLGKARRMTNVYLGRLIDSGLIARVAHGIYARAEESVFGIAVPGRDKIIAATFLYDSDETIGYETGASSLNQLGLSTLIPAKRHIATNRYRSAAPDYSGIVLKRPLVHVTTRNAPYLQMVEALRDMRNYPIDAYNPKELIEVAVERRGLDWEELVRYAHAYLKPDELHDAVGIIFGRLKKYEAA